jgi:hypothetical protein
MIPMLLLTRDQRARLIANGNSRGDHVPVVKFFNPVGSGTWLISELDEDGDTLFGLCDLGFGCPEMGSASLAEIVSVTLPLGLYIERDLHFEGRFHHLRRCCPFGWRHHRGRGAA